MKFQYEISAGTTNATTFHRRSGARMNWGAIAEQALWVAITQIAAVVFVVGVIVGIAVIGIRRRDRP